MLGKNILNKLLQGTQISKTDIIWVCQSVKQIFMNQPIQLKLKPPLIICGDTHGQFSTTLKIFEVCGNPSETNYLFLGDYVDRGLNGIENVCCLFLYKIFYPDRFYLLRGNHECSSVTMEFGFYDECVSKYDKSVWTHFCEVFQCLPITAIIDNTFFCVHGGLSPELHDIEKDIKSLTRPIEIYQSDLLSDLLWSDPNRNVHEWEENDRGTGVFFGVDHFLDFVHKNNFEFVIRAHQVVQEGYDFPFSEDIGLITIFSAPNYCQVGNNGAVVKVDKDLNCSFIIFEADIDRTQKSHINQEFNEALDEFTKKKANAKNKNPRKVKS